MARHQPSNNNKRGDAAESTNDDDQQQTPAATAPPLFERIMFRYIPTALTCSIVLLAMLAWHGWDDDSAGAGGDEEFDPNTGIFRIPETCSVEEFMTSTAYVMGNFTKLMSKVEAGKDTLGAWVRDAIKLKKQKKQQSQAGGSDNKKDGAGGGGGGEDGDAERIGLLTFSLIRWAKGVKSYTAGLEKFCDVETILGSQHNFPAVIQHFEKVSAAIFERRPKQEKDDEGHNKPSSVMRFVGDVVMPELYRQTIKLLNFSMSYTDADAENDDDASEQQQRYQPMSEAELLGRHQQTLIPLLIPFRDVVIRTLMVLSDLAFHLEREDYHTAFLFHLIRLTDGVVARHTSRGRLGGGDDNKKSNNKATAASSHWSPSCIHHHHATNRKTEQHIFCSAGYATQLVSAKGGANYDQPAPEELTEANVAHLFALLRSAFVEQLLALHSSTATSMAPKIAIGFSLLELMRYESAHKALKAARVALDDAMRKGAAIAEGIFTKITNDNVDQFQQQNSNHNNNNNGQQQQEQEDSSSSSSSQPPKQSPQEKASLQVLDRILDCLEQDDVLDHLSSLQQQESLRVPMKWHALLTSSKTKCVRSKNSDDDNNDANSNDGPIASKADVALALRMKWPLAEQDVDGAHDLVAERRQSPQTVQLLLT